MDLRPYWVDLHVHTALSPCGELEMGIPEIVSHAREAGIDIIAVCDHNIADNVPAVMELAAGNPCVVPGIEVQTAEDIHVVTLFERLEEVQSFQEWLWLKMPSTLNDPDIFGYQVVLDAENNIVRQEDVLLIQSVGYSVDEVVAEVRGRGGLSILAHIDRPAYSFPSMLGYLPPDYPADAFELSRRLSSGEAEKWREQYPERTFVRSSDSHSPEGLSKRNCSRMYLAEPTFAEIRRALHGEGGRRVSWPWG